MALWDFFSIDWGPDEAKGDKHLKDYFVEIPEYKDIKDGRFRYIVRRKGSGKTAILEKILIDSDSDPLSFSSSLSLRNFPLNYIRELRDRSFRDKSQFVPVWQFLILVELSKLILQDNGSRPSDAVEEIKIFLASNSFINSVGFVDTIQTLKKNQARVKILPSWMSLEGTHERSNTATIPIHFQQVTDILLNKLSLVNSESHFYFFMDELDEGYRSGDSGLRLILLALLRATEEIALHFESKYLKVYPIVALRSDIFDPLRR